MAPQDARQRPARQSHRQSQSGFTVVEMIVVIALIAVGTAMIAMVTQGVSKLAKADSGTKQVSEFLRKAREEAIAKRRNVKAVFDLTANTIQITRVEYDWTTTPPTPVDNVEQTLGLEGGVQFMKFASIASYPISSFPASTAAVTFTQVSSKPTVVFTPEGFAIDPVNGNPMDGTIFLGRSNDPPTARALTVTGVTSIIERWQYNNAYWVTSK